MCHVKFAAIHQNFMIIIYIVYYLPIILQQLLYAASNSQVMLVTIEKVLSAVTINTLY